MRNFDNRRIMKKIYIIISIIFAGSAAVAQDVNQLYETANAYYNEAKYDSAIIAYEEILSRDKESSFLYYNLGNAYFKQNVLGAAILNYERALKLSPSDEDIMHNLAMARTQTIDKFDEVPQFVLINIFQKVKSTFSANTWGILAFTLFVVVLILVLMFLFAPSVALRRVSFWIACLLLLCSITCKFIESNLRSTESAIVYAPLVTAKSSPDENGKDVFLLHEGTKIRVIEEFGEWTKIQLPNGEQGWVAKETVEVI